MEGAPSAADQEAAPTVSSFQASGHQKDLTHRRKLAKFECASGGFQRKADEARAARKGKQPMSEEEEEEEVVVGPGTCCPPRNVIQLILNPRRLSGIMYDEASYIGEHYQALLSGGGARRCRRRHACGPQKTR